jgi:hypothetical protein
MLPQFPLSKIETDSPTCLTDKGENTKTKEIDVKIMIYYSCKLLILPRFVYTSSWMLLTSALSIRLTMADSKATQSRPRNLRKHLTLASDSL